MSPLHPAIVHFPIGLTIASVIADTAAAATGWSSLASAGAWMVLGAAAGVTVAVAAGYYDMTRDSLCEETQRLVHLHLRFGRSQDRRVGKQCVGQCSYRGGPDH